MLNVKLLIFAIFTFSTFANTYFCDQVLEKNPIQQVGRTKPLAVHAKEVIKHLSGKSKVDGKGSFMVYCLLSAKGFGLPIDFELSTPIEHSKTRELLDGKTSIKFTELMDRQRDLMIARNSEKFESGYKKDLGKMLSKINLYRDISSGNNWLVPQNNGGKISWIPINQFFTKEKITRLSGNSNENPFVKSLLDAKKEYDANGDLTYQLEYKFFKMKLPLVSMVLCLLALASLVLFKKFKISLAFSVSTILVQTVYLVLRVMISGRAPITNMYETVLFSGYGALVISMIIGHFKKEKVFVYMGLGYNFCTLMMINFAHGMLSPSISPLVPVLRDNFWLSTHVTTIIMSYGALALSWILANTIIVKKFFSNLTTKDELYYNDVMYTSLKYGVVMLAAGILLGGVWADYSWGRFWGWDPKETWSLIVLCFYMAILHGKYTNWIKPQHFSHLVAGAFMSVMMAWFGVNYILASGLHSYGFSEGGAYFLGTFFTIQIAILAITVKNFKNNNTPKEA